MNQDDIQTNFFNFYC